ncbi:MAG: type II toxin-antitoxin system VapC family toxin [Galactobacter sp.]|uniref:type II toxin-antitoxin system VapC family toxin n=1 Tax=Galactobacter sp. TaxID=2676125 RepID=UPI0025C47250|nr:PIN domain nuclease [Galactobacter sp.]
MILVDTSVWIEFLKGSDDPSVGELVRLINTGEDIRVSEPIIMELLAGATTPSLEAKISQLTNGLPLAAIQPALDYRAAAQLFVASRKNGHPIRSLSDCLIAAVALRLQIPLFHRDRDFGFLAEISDLRLHQGRA